MSDTTDRSDLRAVARGGMLNLVGAAVTALAGVVLTVAVTRLVSRPTAGVFFSVTSLFMLLSMLGQLGSDTALVYFVARAKALHRRGDVARYVRTATKPTVLVTVSAAAGTMIAAPLLGHLLAAGQEQLATSYLRQMALFLPLAVVANMCLATTRGYGTMRPTTLVEKIGRPGLQLVLVTALAAAGGQALTLGWVLPYLPALGLAGWWALRIHRRHDRLATRIEELPALAGPVTARYWRFALPRAFAGVGQLALQRLDIVIVGALRGPTEAAVYAAATRFLVVGQLANQAISMAVQPRIAGLLAVDDRDRANEIYRSSTAWLVLLAWPMYLLAAVFATEILLLFGAGYTAGRDVIVLLAGAMLVATGCGMVDVMLNMAGRTTWNLANITVAVTVNVVLDFVLIPRYGLTGAAVAWAVAILVKNLVPLTQIWRTLSLHPFGRATVLAAAVAGLCFGALPAGTAAIIGGTGTILVAAGGGASLYLLGLWLLRRPLQLDLLVHSLARRHG